MSGLKDTIGLDLGDLIDGYVQIEAAKHQKDAQRAEDAAADQTATLHDSDYLSGSEAIQGGNAPITQQQKTPLQSYWDRIPKPLLYISSGLLGIGLLAKALK